MRQNMRKNQAGFSLLELLIAVGILSAAAYVALDTVENNTGQRRYDLTELRLEKIRRAIVGDPDLSLNGSPYVSGFVADVGRLPECLEQLVIIDSDCGLGLYAAAEPDPYAKLVTGLMAGWRGPYLTSGTAGLPDGWGNGATAGVDFGWIVELNGATASATKTSPTIVVNEFDVVSFGRDRADGSVIANSYDEDQPMVKIASVDFRTDISSMAVQVEITGTRDHTIATFPEISKDFCVALLDIDPSDISDWRLIPADSGGTKDAPLSLTIIEDEMSATDTLNFAASVETVHGLRPLVVYEIAGTATECLDTGDEGDLGTTDYPIFRRFGLLITPRAFLGGTFRITTEIPEV